MNINIRMKEISPINRFLITAGGVYVVWYILYDYYLLPDGRLDAFLSYSGVSLAGNILNMFGWEIYSDARILAITGTNGVEIQNGCNGMELIGLYMGFIIAYPGGPIQKRIGMTTLFREDTEEGLTFGAGINYRLGSSSAKIKINYAYAAFGRLKNVQRLSLGLTF